MSSDTEVEMEIDRADDVYFVLIDAADSADGDLYRSDLRDQLDALDCEPFPFAEPYADYAEFMETLRFLDALDAIETLRERRPICPTEKGTGIAADLRDAMSPEQTAAIEEVTQADD